MHPASKCYRSATDLEFRRLIAANIRELRRIRHLTQVELARRIGIRAGPMNALESGRHVPSGRVLYRLAGELGVSVDAIMGRPADGKEPARSRPETASASVAEGRAEYLVNAGVTLGGRPHAIRVPMPDDPPVEAATRRKLDDVINAFMALEDLCGAQKRAHIPLYLPFVPNDIGIESLVQQVRQMLGIGHGVIFDYLELFENAGLRVVFLPFPRPLQSAAYYDAENANAFLVVDAALNVERQLFELVKRLGAIYWFTQQACGAIGRAGGAGLLDESHAARKFAALFLMPAASVRATVAQLGIVPADWTYELLLRIKHRFGVSAQAFLFRLSELGLITAPLATEMRARIERYYSTTSYAEPDSTRRILSPNGRLGDLLLAARQKPETRTEARRIAALLKRSRLPGLVP